ncbi:MAG TPA: PAS and helix-turn-helix domain-containing protein [Burkholderiaceae bacterium]
MNPTPIAGDGSAPELTLDYRSAFELAPIASALTRDRIIVDCNLKFLAIFRTQREAVVGHSFELLFPTSEEFERTGRRIATAVSTSETGGYVDERVMRRPGDGSLFWCHVWGHALDRSRPHAAAIWSLDDMSATRPIAVELTPREREIGALLVEGLTSKLVARRLGLSHRTVEIYRSRLLRKHGVDTATGLVRKLIADTPTNLAA